LPSFLLFFFGDREQTPFRPQHGLLVAGLHQEEVPDFVLKFVKTNQRFKPEKRCSPGFLNDSTFQK
jgi:hypothetical protein